MNLMLCLTPEQYALVKALADRTGKAPLDLVQRALDLGWNELQREVHRVPKAPRGKLTLVR